MEKDDERVKALQSHAWGLQTKCNRPGNQIPEAHKSELHKITSKAIQLCSDAVYIAECDFVQRAADFTKRIDEKTEELKRVEEAEEEKRVGKCYRSSGGGAVVVGPRGAEKRPASSAAPAGPLRTSGPRVLAPALTAAEVVARCGDDPEVLQLCGLAIQDGDLDELCTGLKRAGSVTSLDISCNEIADAGIQKLVTALAGGACPKLKELFVSNNDYGELGEQMIRNGLGVLRRGLVIYASSSSAEATLAAATQADPQVAAHTASQAADPISPAEVPAAHAAPLTKTAERSIETPTTTISQTDGDEVLDSMD